jgi:hypothetical protein
MCGEGKEDWRHVMTRRSLDSSLHRADSWGKVKKYMAIWQLPNNFWTALQKGLQIYIYHPLRRVKEDPQNPTPQPVSPFPHGFNQPRNLLKKHTVHNRTWDGTTLPKEELQDIGRTTSINNYKTITSTFQRRNGRPNL